jgi:carbon monoxide dehydrogenase subunit G
VHLKGSFETPVPRKVVWDFLMNPQDIAPCFPDLQSLEVPGPDSFKVKVKVGLGVVRGTMEFDFRIAEKIQPSSAKLVGSGRGVGSNVEIQTGFQLDEMGSGTKVGWVADVTIGGIMAGLGGKLLDSISRKMVTDVIANLQDRLKAKGSA